MRQRRWPWGIGLAAGAGLLWLANISSNHGLHSTARKTWKRTALESIRTYLGQPQSLSNELASLRNAATTQVEGGWIGENLLLMTNGEFFVYRDINAKQDGRIHDLFLARGSDQSWYYSTYHFCSQMISIRVEEQPGSLREFAERFALRTFDGQSDACLEKTWPKPTDGMR